MPLTRSPSSTCREKPVGVCETPPGHLVTRRRNLPLGFLQKRVELVPMGLGMLRKCAGDYWGRGGAAGWVRNMPIKGDFRIPGPGVLVYPSRMVQWGPNEKARGCFGWWGGGVVGEGMKVVAAGVWRTRPVMGAHSAGAVDPLPCQSLARALAASS